MGDTQKRTATLMVAWAAVLAFTAYRIVAQEVFGAHVTQDGETVVRMGIAAASLALAFLWKPIGALRAFFGLLIVVLGAEWLVYAQVGRLPFVQDLVNNPSFNVAMPADKALGLIATLLVLAFLFVLKRRREAFFLAIGDVAAPAEPVKWLAIKAGETWRTLGRGFAIYLSVGTLAFLIIAGRPDLNAVAGALRFLPGILLSAALNAFNEEMTYKASLLSVLEESVGKQQALWLVAAFFGILHYYGIPYGIVGVLLAGFLGWFLAKSMVETRGVFWAWFLHFLQDVWIFLFVAIGSVTPGGQ
mgnify:CR=1 FL=1